MTRKDYVLIARAFRDVADFSGSPDMRTHGLIAVELAEVLGRDNPRFDRARFLEAAGVAVTQADLTGVQS